MRLSTLLVAAVATVAVALPTTGTGQSIRREIPGVDGDDPTQWKVNPPQCFALFTYCMRYLPVGGCVC